MAPPLPLPVPSSSSHAQRQPLRPVRFARGERGVYARVRIGAATRVAYGVTLVELLVALTLMGGVAALVLPSFARRQPEGTPIGDVVRAARGAAIARAQLLSLTVQDNGSWSVHPLPPGDSLTVLDGRLDRAPTAPFQLQLTPLGACLAATPLPADFRGWDAAGCTSLASRSPGAGSRGE